jgi:hypothetical protein
MASRFYRLFPAMDARHGMAEPTDPAEWTPGHRDAYFLGIKRPGRVEDLPQVTSFTVHDWHARGDVVPCTKAFEFYSAKLRQVIEASLTEEDVVQWFGSTLLAEDGSPAGTWWIMHPPDVMPMNVGATTYGGLAGVIKGVIDPGLIGGRNAFKYPYGFPPVLSEAVCEAIRRAGCSGLIFEGVPVRSAS